MDLRTRFALLTVAGLLASGACASGDAPAAGQAGITRVLAEVRGIT